MVIDENIMSMVVYVCNWIMAALIGGVLTCALAALLQEIVTHSRRQKQLDRIENLLIELAGDKIIDDIKHGKGLQLKHDSGGTGK